VVPARSFPRAGTTPFNQDKESTVILIPNLLQEIEKVDWYDELEGRIIHRIKRGTFTTQSPSAVPHVDILFKDGASYAICIKGGVYFEGCMVNNIRQPQELDRITFNRKNKEHTVEFRAKTFPLLQLRAINMDIPAAQFPFQLFETENFDD
jgi:hypothetical protein